MSSTEKKQESSSEKDQQILTNLSADMQINKSERKDNAIQNVETEDEGLKREDEKAELQQTLIQLKDKNGKMHSMLSSNKLSFIWNVCQKDTLQCSRCPPGWTEHLYAAS
ncbi:hypothetical protein OJAV_G00021530 [Oryzias javanicus]|uniref:Uncharacterized protein n=1 Tax=Oryzias javanicus TaxID=123683 RepID=A0A437DHY1_ORYJA|nr:hypothetical protein OJAV_G00021530 [Oryzias javanicus]